MPDPTFEAIWAYSSAIQGHFSIKSAQQMFHYAMLCEPCPEFVEVGSFCGRSASLLGKIAVAHWGRLTLVDNFAMEPGAAQLVSNLRKLNLVFELMAMSSVQAAPLFARPIDLLHIDGGHDFIRQDCALWLPKLKVGGYAMFHDWGQGHHLIMRTVNELEGYEDLGVFGSLAIRRKL